MQTSSVDLVDPRWKVSRVHLRRTHVPGWSTASVRWGWVTVLFKSSVPFSPSNWLFCHYSKEVLRFPTKAVELLLPSILSLFASNILMVCHWMCKCLIISSCCTETSVNTQHPCLSRKRLYVHSILSGISIAAPTTQGLLSARRDLSPASHSQTVCIFGSWVSLRRQHIVGSVLPISVFFLETAIPFHLK